MPLLLPALSRYVLLVLGPPGGAVSAVPAAEVVACPSVAAAVSALATGRRYSAVLTVEVAPALEAAAREAAIPVLITRPGAPATEIAAQLAAQPEACPIPIVDRPLVLGPAADQGPAQAGPGPRLVAVCGPGGTGASVVAAALATTLPVGSVLLADLALHADQAFLHGLSDRSGEELLDLRDLRDPRDLRGPRDLLGLLGLVDAARYRPVTPADVRRHTVAVAAAAALAGPGLRLLPGLRRPSHWTAVAPTAFDSVLTALLESADLVVADITGEVEGENETGSVDVEERNYMARRTTLVADAVVAVAGPGVNGARRSARLIADLRDHGVDPARIMAVVSRGGGPISISTVAMSPRGLLPAAAVTPLAASLSELLRRLPPAERTPALVPVAPGSLGCCTS